MLRRSNKYIDETTPWVLGKDEQKKDRLATVLYNLLESIRFSAVLLSSFMPQTAEKILDMLNTQQRSLDSLTQFGNPGMRPVRRQEGRRSCLARIDAEEFQKQLEADRKQEDSLPRRRSLLSRDHV